jgi:hypothetical protein
LGGHTPKKGQQGCTWLAICLCGECQHKLLEYIEDGGCVMSMEELFEHATGAETSGGSDEWRTKFIMEDTSNGEVCRKTPVVMFVTLVVGNHL